MKLRQYQKEAVDAVLKDFSNDTTRQLVCIPTGGGKTIITMTVTKELNTKTLFLAHRGELLTQAQTTAELIIPNADVGILQGQERNGLDATICFATIQTARQNIEELQKEDYKLLICDEAHHAASNSYRKLFNELSFLDGNKDKLLLGVTATPFRNDKLGLGDIFEKIVYEKNIAYMIENGYLCDVRGLNIDTGIKLQGIKERAGDFAVNELSKVINVPERNKLIVEMYIDRGEKRRGVVFCSNITHAVSLAEEFNRQGIKSKAVYGTMSYEERKNILADYANGKVDIITNVGILTEGWDAPCTSIIMMARPTKSKILYIQCIGRGLRLCENKNDCLIMDFVDVSENNNLYSFSVLEHEELITNRNSTSREDNAQKSSPDNKLPSEIYVPSKSECKVKSFDPLNRARQDWHTIDAVHYKINADNGYIYICQLYGECYFFAHVDGDNNLSRTYFGNLTDLEHVFARAESSNASVMKLQAKNHYVSVPNGTLWCCPCLNGLAYSIFVDMCGNIIFPFGTIKFIEMDEQMHQCDTLAWSMMNINSFVKGRKPITDKQKYIIQDKNLYYAPDELSAWQAWKIINYYCK